MLSLKLLADDLTGALDTSAEFVGACGPFDVVWSADSLGPGVQSFAIDSGTRECDAQRAAAIVRRIAPRLGGADIACKKIDSLLRGPWVAELEACLQSGLWDACIVAPAFPHQGRITRGGRQYQRMPDGSWSVAGPDIVDQFRQRGLEARLTGRDTALQNGISIFDAERDDDLDRIAEIGRDFSGRVLWCGSGGLAAALARGTDASVSTQLKTPLLGVFGSDHAATAAQLSQCEAAVLRSSDVGPNIDKIKRALGGGIALIRLETSGGVSRAAAAEHFASELARLAQAIDPPGTLVIAGGETLKAQMLAVEARALRVIGRIEPGLPKSVIQGGPWAGVDVISKSGAFGPPDLWFSLLRQNRLM
jgi:D-threonate/D-erythronate kinase